MNSPSAHTLTELSLHNSVKVILTGLPPTHSDTIDTFQL
jgi:hypothetical protein